MHGEEDRDHIPHMLKMCSGLISDPKAMQYMRNECGTPPMILDDSYYRNIFGQQGFVNNNRSLISI